LQVVLELPAPARRDGESTIVKFPFDPSPSERGSILPAHEAYRARLKGDTEAMDNFRTAQRLRIILREERTFLEPVEGTLNRPSLMKESH
jgi:hypothetical protein